MENNAGHCFCIIANSWTIYDKEHFSCSGGSCWNTWHWVLLCCTPLFFFPKDKDGTYGVKRFGDLKVNWVLNVTGFSFPSLTELEFFACSWSSRVYPKLLCFQKWSETVFVYVCWRGHDWQLSTRWLKWLAQPPSLSAASSPFSSHIRRHCPQATLRPSEQQGPVGTLGPVWEPSGDETATNSNRIRRNYLLWSLQECTAETKQ